MRDVQHACAKSTGRHGNALTFPDLTSDNSGILQNARTEPRFLVSQTKGKPQEKRCMKGNDEQGCVQAVSVAAMMYDLHRMDEALL